MFWAKEEEESSLVQLLKSDNVTLEAVLLNEFVVQDSRYGRPELVVYITEKENMVALLNLSLNPTIDPNVPMKQQYRLSFIASEILTIRGTDVFQEKILTTDETRKVLTDFLSDDTPMTHLVAGFFAKIMECLLSRKLTLFQTFELLRDTAFFDKCLQNINLGAIECLLENLVRIPNNSDGTLCVRTWMINDNLFEKLAYQISESNSDDKNECLSEVYCEILRELRDKLYMVENKEDELHDKAMEEPLIAKLADNLVVDENCSSEDLAKKSSMINSSAKVLIALINTNFVADAPAHHLEEVERNLIEERHFTYGLMRPCADNDNYEQSYQPDPERIVEGIVANRLPNIFQTVLKSIQANGSVWQPLLRLVIEVCNTNHLSTHEKLANALQKLPFIKLIEAAKKHPRATVMHSLLVKIVALILHSKFPHSEETLSPAAEYLLTGSDLIKNIYDSACSFHPPTDLISSCGLRAFNQNLGDVLLRAKKSSIAPPKLATLFKNDERWAELEDIILNYNAKHRPLLQRDYNNESSMMSSLPNDSHGFNDSEEWTDASAKFAEFDASSSNNRNFGSLGFEANLQRFSDLDGQFDVTPDEDEFKKLCSERANSSSCSGTRSVPDFYTWPGEEEKKGETRAKPNPSQDEIWADFSSFVSGADGAAANTSNPNEFSWPGAPTAEQGENTDWPLNSSHDSKPTDPATVGLAASISDDNTSEA